MPSQMDRRTFLSLTGLGGAAAVTLRDQKPPNILVIMTDQHSSHAVGCYGTPSLRRPTWIGSQAGARYSNTPIVSRRCAFRRA